VRNGFDDRNFNCDSMKTTVGKLRNITTGRLHTDIGQVYTFIEDYTGEKGIMTHHLPSACPALQEILKRKLDSSWFDGEWQREGLDTEVDVPDLTEEERKEFWERFNKANAEMWEAILRIK